MTREPPFDGGEPSVETFEKRLAATVQNGIDPGVDVCFDDRDPDGGALSSNCYRVTGKKNKL